MTTRSLRPRSKIQMTSNHLCHSRKQEPSLFSRSLIGTLSPSFPCSTCSLSLIEGTSEMPSSSVYRKLWGMGVIKKYQGLLAVHALLGVFEGGLFPGVTYYITMWYARHECGLRMALFFSAATATRASGGLLVFAIDKMNGVGGSLKRGVGIAMHVGFGNLGGAISAFCFLPKYSPRFIPGHITLACTVAMSAILTILMSVYLRLENNKRNLNELAPEDHTEDQKTERAHGGDYATHVRYTV
ncbi:uncharacterized protein PAC_10191 [Phialocephala subalpina]|uniref:Major facilitator superfamily (MFS) profile domain-containing protein n=1 Tax=Phialocephala subalpina TaxID=576137 RepID=A0A1L7X5N3_9HELO|nr:uncharacterized protein PAC_10191 [Phialocephala subalpina]